MWNSSINERPKSYFIMIVEIKDNERNSGRLVVYLSWATWENLLDIRMSLHFWYSRFGFPGVCSYSSIRFEWFSPHILLNLNSDHEEKEWQRFLDYVELTEYLKHFGYKCQSLCAHCKSLLLEMYFFYSFWRVFNYQNRSLVFTTLWIWRYAENVWHWK